jgi:N utilization substance protein B
MNSVPPSALREQSSATRLAAVQALYQIDITGAGPEEVLREFWNNRWSNADRRVELPLPNSRMLEDLVLGVSDQRSAMDTALQRALAGGHRVDRLEILLRAVLRAGAYELKAVATVPSNVVINEYVDLAHAFFAGKEPALVNAVLDRLAGEFRPTKRSGGASGGDEA